MVYSPSKPPAVGGSDGQAIAAYLDDELKSVASQFRDTANINFSVTNKAPTKPRTGLVVYADGTNWNPGSGEGLYVYNAAGTWVWLEDNPSAAKTPSLWTRTVKTSGSGSYTPPTGCSAIIVRGKAGGGGGAGSGTSPGAAGAGGNTTFGTLTATGGAAAVTASGGSGSGASGGDVNLTGGGGGNGSGITNQWGGRGGGGRGGREGQPNQTAGGGAPANSGCGGGGGGCGATVNSGGGGGEGGEFEALIVSPAGPYAWAVGAAGTAGTAGTSGSAGGAGGSGLLLIEEFY